MRVLADTCIWSEVLRYKRPNTEIITKFKDLVEDGRIAIIGPIRQELLSGISNIEQFKKLKEVLSVFPDVPLKTDHFEQAAEYCNICRQKGVQGSTIDFLICAVASIENFFIYTTDKDFENYKKYLSVKLLK